jgi:aspartate/methionine/tyrosine aminotransferase
MGVAPGEALQRASGRVVNSCALQKKLQVLGCGDCALDAVPLPGMSKAWGLPGLRLGWLAMQDAGVYRRVQELKDHTTM